MRDITQVQVSQIRIYAPDVLPFSELSITSNLKKFIELFQFKGVQPDQDGLRLNFGGGALIAKNSTIPIHSLTVDLRRIGLHVRGGSADANLVHEAVFRALAHFSPAEIRDEPLVKTEESNCVSTLDIDFDELLAPAFLNTVRKNAGLGTEAGMVRSLDLKEISLSVNFVPDPALQEAGIALVSKVVTFQPRTGTQPRERRFFTGSPNDSDTHIQLVEAVEEAVMGSRSSSASQSRS